MPLLPRYIFRQLCVTLAVMSASLVAAVWLTQSLRFIDFVVNRGVSLSVFFALSSLMIPSFLVIVLPIALFVSVLVVYHRLSTESEVVVMQSAGCSPQHLAKPALMLAVVVAVIGYLMTLYIMPHSYRAFKNLQQDIRKQYSAALLQEGVFTPLGAQMTVYIGKRTADGALADILIHDTRKKGSLVTILAKQGAIVTVNGAPRVVVMNGSRQELITKTGQLSLLYFDRYTLDLDAVHAAAEGARKRTIQEYFVPELLMPDETLPVLEQQRLKAAGHSRLLSPLYAFPFALLGLLSVMMGEFSRRGYALRLTLGVLAMAALQGASIGAESAAARSLSAVPLMYFTLLLPTILCVWLLLHPEKTRTIGKRRMTI